LVAILLRLSFLGFRDTTHLVQYIRGEVVVEQAPRYDRQVDHVLHYADVCDVAMLPISQRPYHKATDVNHSERICGSFSFIFFSEVQPVVFRKDGSQSKMMPVYRCHRGPCG